LEKGFTPSTVVNDAPLFFDAATTGSQPWEPKNYDGKFDGPMSLRTALARSKNMVSIRVLQSTGAEFAQDWLTRFGFEADKHPPYLTMALGAGSVTPLQMASAYGVFANGGYRVEPMLVSKVTSANGKVLIETQPPVLDESMRTLEARSPTVTSGVAGAPLVRGAMAPPMMSSSAEGVAGAEVGAGCVGTVTATAAGAICSSVGGIGQTSVSVVAAPSRVAMRSACGHHHAPMAAIKTRAATVQAARTWSS
jgi:membrane carboxypeptidase/penicillin-binding protein